MKAVRKYTDTDIVKSVENEADTNDAVMFLYEQYADQISSFIIGKGGSQQDGQDVFQEAVVAFINVVRNGKYRGEASVKTFLVSIAKNIWYNELRKRQSTGNREKLYEDSRQTIETDITAYIGDREIRQQFLEILGKLGENCKKILLLFYYEDMPMKDMVNELPYENEQVVRNKKYKCLQQLTTLVKAHPKMHERLKD